MAGRGRKQKPKNISKPAHPPASNVIVVHAGGEEYKAYVTHFVLNWNPPVKRAQGDPAWTLEFSYLISKKREKGVIAAWERNPDGKFKIEILTANVNKYIKSSQTYTGLATFKSVQEEDRGTMSEAFFVMEIIGQARNPVV